MIIRNAKNVLEIISRRKNMDDFKRNNINQATAWDWNAPRICKRRKGDTAKLHRLARHRLKNKIKKELKYE